MLANNLAATTRANIPAARLSVPVSFAKFEILRLTKKTTDISDKQSRHDILPSILEEIRRNLRK